MHQEITSLNIEKDVVLLLDKQGYKDINNVDINNHDISEEDWLSATKVPDTKTASELLDEELAAGCILSFIDDLDSLIEDEIVPGSIVELTGLPGSGMTQLSFQFSLSVQLPKIYGGADGGTVYISTNKSFCRERLEGMAANLIDKFNSVKRDPYSDLIFTTESLLRQIYVVEVDDCTELFACLRCLDSFLEGKNVRLIVLDSIAYPLKQINLDNRKPITAKIFNLLRLIANKLLCAVIITNEMTTRINNSEAYETPSFGDSFYHNINTRIVLSKTDNSILQADVIKSRLQEPRVVQFNL